MRRAWLGDCKSLSSHPKKRYNVYNVSPSLTRIVTRMAGLAQCWRMVAPQSMLAIVINHNQFIHYNNNYNNCFEWRLPHLCFLLTLKGVGLRLRTPHCKLVPTGTQSVGYPSPTRPSPPLQQEQIRSSSTFSKLLGPFALFSRGSQKASSPVPRPRHIRGVALSWCHVSLGNIFSLGREYKILSLHHLLLRSYYII